MNQIIGDVDNDGKITEIDMLLIFAYKTSEIELSFDELKRADTDGDGTVAIADALNIQKHIEGREILDEWIKK